MTGIDRSIPKSIRGSDGIDYTKMVFPVTDDEHVSSESMWVQTQAGRTYRLRNIPGWAPHLALDDLVEGDTRKGVLRFKRVVKRSGHSTYRIAMQHRTASALSSPQVQAILKTGCDVEVIGSRVLAVDVPPRVDIAWLYEFLELGMRDGVWWFDELHFDGGTR